MITVQATDVLNRPLAPGNVVVYNTQTMGEGMIYEGVYVIKEIEYSGNNWLLRLKDYWVDRVDTVTGTYDPVDGWELDYANVIKIAESVADL